MLGKSSYPHTAQDSQRIQPTEPQMVSFMSANFLRVHIWNPHEHLKRYIGFGVLEPSRNSSGPGRSRPGLQKRRLLTVCRLWDFWGVSQNVAYIIPNRDPHNPLLITACPLNRCGHGWMLRMTITCKQHPNKQEPETPGQCILKGYTLMAPKGNGAGSIEVIMEDQSGSILWFYRRRARQFIPTCYKPEQNPRMDRKRLPEWDLQMNTTIYPS